MTQDMNLKDIPTPYYLYQMDLLEKTLDEAKTQAGKYGYHIHYALKANTRSEILELIQTKGFGADCVSGGEIQAALDHGFKAESIAFAGVGKRDDEIVLGLDNQIFSFNVESVAELEVIHQLAEERNQTAQIALRINPNIDAKTHHYISTGLEENKFGINFSDLEAVLSRVGQMPKLKLQGLHFHIGSQITDMDVFKQLCRKINKVQEYIQSRGVQLEHINVGGGLGINYFNPFAEPIPDFKSYFEVFHRHLELQPRQSLHFELGRSLVAQCGSLMTKVLYIKEGSVKKFAIVDAAMTELMRPALYHAYHYIHVHKKEQNHIEKYDVVGPVCESTDVFRKEAELPELWRGDLLEIKSAGAYGESMASTYNLRPNIESYFIK